MRCAFAFFRRAANPARARARSMVRMRANHMHTRVLRTLHQAAHLHIAMHSNTDIIVTGVHAGLTSVTGANRPVIVNGRARLVTSRLIAIPLGVVCFFSRRMSATCSQRRRFARGSELVSDSVWRSRRYWFESFLARQGSARASLPMLSWMTGKTTRTPVTPACCIISHLSVSLSLCSS